MIYAFRDTCYLDLLKFGVFWSADPAGGWRGACQVFMIVPVLRLRRVSAEGHTVGRWRSCVFAASWTGRTHRLQWFYRPGYLNVELRTPSDRRLTLRIGERLSPGY